MKKIILAFVIAFLLVPLAQAQVTIGTCINETHVQFNTTIVINENDTYEITNGDPINCPNGCEEGAGQYGDNCRKVIVGGSFEIFMVLMIMAFILIGLAIGLKHYLPALLSTILFSLLTAQAFGIRIISGETTYILREPAFAYIMFLFIIISLFVFFYGVVKHIMDSVEDEGEIVYY